MTVGVVQQNDKQSGEQLTDPKPVAGSTRMTVMPHLRLRPPRLADEAEADRAHRELARDDFVFLFRWPSPLPWPTYLDGLDRERRGLDLPPGRVPSTYLFAAVGDELVGRVSIRHVLNETLLLEGGHIGYCVRPAHRRLGYATEMLRQALVVARAVGVDRVLVTTDDGNVGSQAVITRCGGEYEDTRIDATGRAVRRYWIP
jgi:predicted acetyltransferase